MKLEDVKKAQRDELVSLYESMVLIREVETALSRLFADGEVPGFIHLSIGQEAVPAGVSSALQKQDTLTTTHRGHGHVLARGMDVTAFFKEIMGRQSGLCKGRGGSMHVADLKLGILGANGIVGAGIPIALGSAMAHQRQKNNGVAVSYFGDGAMAEGVLHETLNMAALWKSPLLLVCENNGWSEFSPTSAQFAATLQGLAEAFSISYETVDGNDVMQVAAAAQRATASIRDGNGPFVLECVTQRVHGHFEGDPQKYRDESELKDLPRHDPLSRVRQEFERLGVDPGPIDQKIKEGIEQAIAQARKDGPPDFVEAMADVYTAVASGDKR